LEGRRSHIGISRRKQGEEGKRVGGRGGG
jgi:hypothetical protein